MSAEDGSSAAERRLHALLAELHASSPPAGLELVRHVVRRAGRQRAALVFAHLLVSLARTVPEAIALGAGRRRRRR